MNTLQAFTSALPWMLAMALLGWCVATLRRNVGLVDIFWSLFLLVAALWYGLAAASPSHRAWLVLALTTLWALRLAIYLARRNWNAPEDHRYQAIRARNQPGFVWKSLYLVFGLQAVLALIVAAPLFAAIQSTASLQWLDLFGAAVVLGGILIEGVADAQLGRFRSDAGNRGRVMDQGLWRYSRHPNYFGEFCVWWGFFLIALAAGAWWAIISPLLMSLLLLRVSGVTLLEKDIGTRRPGYGEYVARTNAFFPGPRRSPSNCARA
jgi:steroid 5-alpha reductase family enzyme